MTTVIRARPDEVGAPSEGPAKRRVSLHEHKAEIKRQECSSSYEVSEPGQKRIMMIWNTSTAYI